MKVILLNLLRRKSRTALTILGIASGILMIVVLAALVERNNEIVAGGSAYQEGKVTVIEEKNVTASGMASPNRMLSTDIINELQRVPGVREVVPQVILPLDPSEAIPVGTARMILGGFLESQTAGDWHFADGGAFDEKNRRVAVVGSDLVRRLDAKVGREITLRGREFRVTGILDTALNGLDASVFIPLADAQEMFYEALPESFRKTVGKHELAVAVTVYPEPGRDADVLADELNKEVEGILALGPMDWADQASQVGVLLTAIVFSLGTIALLAGGLLVLNAMTMSVSERIREIGMERAMGATTYRVARQFLGESILMGICGGVFGLLGGLVIIVLINGAMASSALLLFSITPRLVAAIIGYAVVLSGVAGVYPALHAARLSPMAALAHE
ncbi:MAG: ABC transporter permease [Candidatus Aquicultorales bacterium]